MAVDLVKAAKFRKENGITDEYSPEEWVDILKIQEMINETEQVIDNQGGLHDYLTQRGAPSQSVLDLVCYKVTETAASMMENGYLSGADQFLNADGSLNERGFWRVVQMASIACFQYGFEYGRKNGVEVAGENKQQ